MDYLLGFLKTVSDLLRPHEHLGPFSIALVAAVTVAVAFMSYISTVGWNFTRYLADRYFEIFRVGISKPEFMNPAKTRRYPEEWPLGHADRPAYEAYARLCWSHAYDIYGVKFLYFFFRRKFIKQYANVFETYRRLHGKWLDNNRTYFPSRSFHHFIRKCKWRDYFDPRTADLLRWNNEVEDFDEKVLHPLRVTDRNRLLEYVDELPGKPESVVADVGCGNGSFIRKLAALPFQNIYGIDYSDNMLEVARAGCQHFANVEIKKMDALDLSELYGRCNVVFSLNSILPRDPRDTTPMLREIARVLKPGGRFVAILPSFDTVVELKRVELPMFIERRAERHPRLPGVIVRFLGCLDRWRKFHLDKRMSGWFDNTAGRFSLFRNATMRLCGVIVGRYLYADDGVNIQRLIHGDEIKRMVEKCGLELERQEKFEYTWELASRYDYGHFPAEKYIKASARKIYDWFVVARKPDQHG